jgi:phosphoribosylaminoimidazole-succinocarboxamide synthase
VSESFAPLVLPDVRLFRRGKVRDTFDLGGWLLMVASDRISAFDVVLPTAIPGKGAILTQLSRFWFELTAGLVPNHLVSTSEQDLPQHLEAHSDALRCRMMIVKKAERIDVECVVRGYLAGSAWAEYRGGGTVAGEPLPAGLRQADKLPAPIFTPAAKNDAGHDVNITTSDLADLIGEGLARRLEEVSRDLYGVAADYSLGRGIILADTKFEFGRVDGELTLIDEVLTPDSSRFWDAASFEPGIDPPSFDKQYVRDWLARSGWNKEPPGPALPPEVVAGTQARYREALERLTGQTLEALCAASS